MRLLYVMDPLETMSADKDTTFALMRSSGRRGHESFHAEIGGLFYKDGRVFARCRRAFVSDTPPHTRAEEEQRRPLADFDAVLIRKDPPFDRLYLYATLLLELAKADTLVLNDPRGLRDANEKLYAFAFAEYTPRGLVSANCDEIHAFVREVGGRAVIKPLDGAGGFGVLALSAGDANARAIVDMLTREGKKFVIVQEYLDAVREGDKRILLLDGEPLGAILRVPRADDFRSNIHVGGNVVPAEITPGEHAMIRAMAPRLRADGLIFVGLDVIGERLTEVNVTSPTGIQQLGRFLGSHPEDRVIEWIETRTKR
jgi:glutathione synthase